MEGSFHYSSTLPYSYYLGDSEIIESIKESDPIYKLSRMKIYACETRTGASRRGLIPSRGDSKRRARHFRLPFYFDVCSGV